MGGHHALGVAGGAAGIQLDERIVPVYLDTGPGPGQAGQQIPPVQAVGLAGGDDGNAGGQLGAKCRQRRFHAIEHQQHPGVGVFDNECQLSRRQPVVERHGDRAHLAGGHEQQAVLDAVFTQDRHPLPHLDTQLEKAVAQLVGYGVDLAIAH